MSESPKEKGPARRSLLSVHPEVGEIDEIRLYRGEKVLSVAKKIAERDLDQRINTALAVDVFYTYYLPVPLIPEHSETDDKETGFRRSIIAAMTKSESLWKSKVYTTADTLTSIVAAASFVERLNKLLPPRRCS